MTHPHPLHHDKGSASRRDRQADRNLEREQALWALDQLATTTEVGSDTEPTATTVSDAEIATLLDGRLSPEERERVLAALETDDDSATVWLATAAALEREQELSRRRPSGVWYQKPWTWAVAASFVLVSILAAYPLMPSLSGRIDQDLRLALAAGWLPPMPRASAAYGFGPKAGPTPLTQAIHSGYAAVVTQLRNTNDPNDPRAATPVTPSQPTAAYHFGRWLALLDAAVLASPPPRADAFWSAQPRTAQRLMQGLEREPDSTRVLRVLERLVQQLDAGAPDFDGRWRQAMQRDVLYARFELNLPES